MIRNYTYGAKAPHINLDRVNEQIFKAHRYRNKLVEIEQGKRKAIADLQTKLIPGLADAQKEIESAKAELVAYYDEISARNAQARSKTGTSEDRKRKSELRQAVRSAVDKIKACKAVEKSPEFSDAVAKVQDQANTDWKRVRAESGVYHGTYQSVDAEARTSFRNSVGLPRFMRWEGCGCVSLFDSDGISIDDAMACTNTKLKIEATDNPKFFVVYLRIGSSEEDNRVPVWAVARVKLHRPIPPGSIIKWAYLEKERIGLTEHWQFRVTINIPDGAVVPKPRAADGSCGVNLGWRKVEGGLRVAYWVGSDGAEGELVIPESRIERYRHPDELRAIRDLKFNEIRAALVEWLRGREIPEWMVESTKFIAQLRSPGKLAGLILRWRENRFAGDEAIYEMLESWRKQDKHLCNWEGHERSTEWRKEMYRQFAVMLSRRYKTIITEDSDWAKMARRAAPDEADEIYTRYVSRIASVGQLRAILCEYGATKTAAKDNTRRCNACGVVNVFDAAKHLHHACDSCGAKWDQDANAARNSLAAIASGGVVAELLEPCEGVEKKPVRARITVAEWRRRVREKRTARKAEDKPLAEAV
jgi:uncharacterized protein (DUF983 family)